MGCGASSGDQHSSMPDITDQPEDQPRGCERPTFRNPEVYDATFTDWGQLGLILQEARGPDGKQSGVMVKSITDQIAKDAGVRPGSKVLKINGEDIEFGKYDVTIDQLTHAEFPKTLTLRGEKL